MGYPWSDLQWWGSLWWATLSMESEWLAMTLSGYRWWDLQYWG